MCGIATIAATDREIPAGAIKKMTEQLRHRGPDAHSCVELQGCHLGHTRLSVIDLTAGGQPMTEETRRYWIALNGEIYTYRELRRDLEKRGRRFRTQSDTEVLLRAYQEYGEDVLTHLNGQFAFAIWDQVEQRLFAARDRLGEKPLYWACSDQGHLVLASEIKSLLASGLILPRIDRISVDAYLALLYVPPDRTIYENVCTLPPGHALSWQGGEWRQWSYWRPAYSTRQVSDPREAIERLRFLIARAVRRQIVADVPVGAFLSGGLDSSAIVALMARQTDRPVVTFSVGFGDLINELPFARAVADTYHTDHHEIQMEIPVGELLERMAETYDEPFGDSSNIPTSLMAEFARRYVKVVLSGDGGDELFGGYEWYLPLIADNNLRADVATASLLKVSALAWRVLAKAGFPVSSQRDAAVHAYRTISNKRRHPDLWERHLALVTVFNTDERSAAWNGGAPRETHAVIRKIYGPEPTVEGIDRATDFDVRCYLPGDILVKVDRAAMAHGLETRAPLLDVDLVEFVLSLPNHLRFRHDGLKHLLRDACWDLWPELVRNRSKQGFGAPLWNWIQRPDVQSLIQRVCTPHSPLRTLLPGVGFPLQHLNPQQAWTMLCLGLWLERRAGCLNRL